MNNNSGSKEEKQKKKTERNNKKRNGNTHTIAVIVGKRMETKQFSIGKWQKAKNISSNGK